MNDTRRTAACIDAMMLAALATAGYAASLQPQAQRVSWLGGARVGGSHLEDES